jgi:hypothetical protein
MHLALHLSGTAHAVALEKTDEKDYKALASSAAFKPVFSARERRVEKGKG